MVTAPLYQAEPVRAPDGLERIGDVLSRWLAGVSSFGLCRACWCRQDLGEGAVCLRCHGMIVRVRTRG